MKKVCLRVLPFSENEAVEPKKIKTKACRKMQAFIQVGWAHRAIYTLYFNIRALT